MAERRESLASPQRRQIHVADEAAGDRKERPERGADHVHPEELAARALLAEALAAQAHHVPPTIEPHRSFSDRPRSDTQRRDGVLLEVRREQRARVDLGDDVRVPDQGRPRCEERRRVSEATGGAEERRLANRARPEQLCPRDDRVGQMERVDHDVADGANRRDARDDVVEHRTIAERNERLRDVVGQRAEPGPETGGEHERGGHELRLPRRPSESDKAASFLCSLRPA